MVDGCSCVSTAAGQDRNYGIGTVVGDGAVGGRVYDWNQNTLKLMSYFEFFTVVICFT